MRVIVTRPAAQGAPWVASLCRHGVDAVALPLIDIVPPQDPRAVQRAWQALGEQAMVFFVSANAVQHFFALRPAGAAWPAGTLAAAPGPGTAAALAPHGVPAGQVVAPPHDAPSFDAEALWAVLQTRPWAGRQVLVVRGERGRDWLADQLRAAGATVHYVAAYGRRPPALDAQGRAVLAAALQAPAAHLWLFSSSEAVRHLQTLAPGAGAGARALATHPRIALAARAAGFGEVHVCAPGEAAVRLALQACADGETRSIQSPTP